VARRIGEVRRLLVATSAYLAQHGIPQQPDDLRSHEVIGFDGMFPGGEWRYMAGGRSAAVNLTVRLTVNDASAAIEAAGRGEGLTAALSYMVVPRLAAGTLVGVLGAFTPPAVPVHVVYPQSRLVAAKVRAFVDFAVPRPALVLAPAAQPL
jgi:DNA-binding transcriptional LysR family regulator